MKGEFILLFNKLKLISTQRVSGLYYRHIS